MGSRLVSDASALASASWWPSPRQGAEMETILEEIIVHFRPEPEEELHSAVHALLIKCFQVRR